MFSFALFGLLLFADVVLGAFAPAVVVPRSVYMSSKMLDVIGDYIPSNFIYQSDQSSADILIHIVEEGYSVEGILKYEEQLLIDRLIHGYHRTSMVEQMPDALVSLLDQVMIANIEWENVDEAPSNHLGFIVITSIYFMLLSFSTAVANEVVNEKTSNVIEVILTSVSHRQHYYSKLLIGWFTMLSQLIIHGFALILWFMIRITYDNGEGLLELLYRWQWLSIRFVSINELINSFNITFSHVFISVLCVIFLMLGVLLVQLLMVLVSIYINSIEEAAAIQGPFYLGMLVIYYLAIFINSSEQLNHGWGYLFSYIPILSMLFMPSRLLMTNVMFSELLLSMSFAIITLIICMFLGEEHYQKNLLKGSAKSSYVKNEI
jgi:ABC-2 type transport system permease protein